MLSFLSFLIFRAEYGVLNFGDSDLPPYQPDTLLEKVFNTIWFAVTIPAGLLWFLLLIYVIGIVSISDARRAV